MENNQLNPLPGEERILLILGLDTTTLSCSVALLQDDRLLAEMTTSIKKTHSERLMPMLDTLLKEAGLEREELQAVAAAAGPGSFTGLRIGVSTARALAQGLGIPAVPVCTLEALAEAAISPGALICPLLDARRSQVYSALYRRSPEEPYPLETLLEPQALALDELAKALRSCDGPVIFLGEGLHSYTNALREALPGQAVIAPAPYRVCRAALVACRARLILQKDPEAPYEKLLPIYLRRPEAERLAAKKRKKRNEAEK
ncbi:MAG: tRNA (adenosine(37)-N6)-threonylcarbamoyltransferase complex dimerization subunit type 1 TsaB [Bacillota bacterium]|nr:tRNA (adenosine(37)-N6)-threonylcarbamoyltransferase complex dimerization subunit type 1 TsaB [Bacillota bacterium]